MTDTPDVEGVTSSSRNTAESGELQNTKSGSTDPFLSGDTSRPKSSGHDAGLESGDVSAEVVKEGDLIGRAEEAPETKTTLEEFPPSPPLTRYESSHEVPNDTLSSAVEKQGEPAEEDLTEWHPLDHTRTESKDMNQTQDTTFVDDSVTHESNEKHVLTPIPQNRASNLNLQIVTKTPSPQPWDLVNPPQSNHGDATDYYSTIGTKNFGMLQQKSRSRPRIPHSSYYFGPPPTDTAYGTNPVGHIGIHHPREVFRVERDYTGGELVQFASTYPLELEGRITPTQFLETINTINELLISAHSIRHSFFNNLLAVFTLQISRLIVASHYDKEMSRLEHLVQDLNTELYNPVGLNIRWPRKTAFLFLEIEYY